MAQALLNRSASLVTPMRGKNTTCLGHIAILAATEVDLNIILNFFDRALIRREKLYLGSLYCYGDGHSSISIAGPLMGAPYGAVLMETLIAWGVRHFVFLGWCGSIARDLEIGTVFFPSSALIDEGTSRHYDQWDTLINAPSSIWGEKMVSYAEKSGLPFKKGCIWTTDALFRETAERVQHYQQEKADAVDMETSAFFSIARYHGVSMDAVLIVSDELHSGIWVKGFSRKNFKRSRLEIIRGILNVSEVLEKNG